MSDEGKVIEMDKTYAVHLTEKEMAAVGKCLAAYFAKLTAEKLTIPRAHVELVFNAMHKMKAACESAGIVLVQ